jgi:hypothetical protein
MMAVYGGDGGDEGGDGVRTIWLWMTRPPWYRVYETRHRHTSKHDLRRTSSASIAYTRQRHRPHTPRAAARPHRRPWPKRRANRSASPLHSSTHKRSTRSAALARALTALAPERPLQLLVPEEAAALVPQAPWVLGEAGFRRPPASAS